MRLGLLGGTFNPIHIGHLRAAVEVREAFNLDRILLIPSACPPHKEFQDVVSAEDRLEMVRLAVQGVPFLEASGVEVARPGTSFTIETLKYFQDHFGPEASIYFVIGLDAFSEIATWKSYKRLFPTAHFIVMTRPGTHFRDLKSFVFAHISEEYKYDINSNQYTHPHWCSIFCVEITHLNISATQIRTCMSHDRSISFLVPRIVEEYILKRNLYQ